MEKVIIVDHLYKDNLFSDISFSLQKGEFAGILSPKGSGKTTLLKIMSGVRNVTSGFVSVLGFDPIKRQPDFLKQISYIGVNGNRLYQNLTALVNFELYKNIYEINEREFRKNIDELISIFSLSKLLDVPVKNLSIEHKKRLEFALCLIHKPSVVFLDEPFHNLDYKTDHVLSDSIYDFSIKNKVTVLLASDKVEDLLGLTRRSIVIDAGNLVYDGPLEKITKNYE